jgi:hypothetical protein
VQTTHDSKQTLGSLTITHPFHHLNSQSFKILKIKKLNGIRLYSIKTDNGVLCVPESWTDRNPLSSPSVSNSLFSPLSPWVLKELVKLLKILDDFPSSSENKH